MKHIDEDMLDVFRAAGRCENCWNFCGVREPHHLFGRGMGGGERLDVQKNLMGLCRTCHRHFHDGKIAKDRLVQIVARREGVTAEEIVQAVRDLQRA